MVMRFARFLTVCAILMLFTLPVSATFCVPGKKPAEPPPPDPHPPVCEPKKCDKCSKSPCYLAMGSYVNDFVDLQIPTAGTYPLTISRRYDSSRPTDGPLGAGWSSSLTARLYYATYLRSAPSTYSYEADILMPDGVLYRFTINGSGDFVPPLGRYDALLRNGDGTYALTLQRSREVYRFNADGSMASFTDEYGNQITYTYDASGKLQRMADAAGSGRYIDVTWGGDGRIASLTDNGSRILKYFYETGSGTLTSFSDPVASSDSSQRTTYYNYVSGRFGPVLSRIEDRWHRIVSEIEWYANGKLKSYTEGQFDPANPSTSVGERYVYAYITASPPYAGGVTKTDSFAMRTYLYDGSGLVDDPATSYDAVGQVERESASGRASGYTYDGNGRLLTVTQSPNGVAAQTVVWTYSYDLTFPDKVASIIPKDIYGTARSDWAGWAYVYNVAGGNAPGALSNVFRIRSDKTTRDQVATFSYDTKGHLLTFTDDNSLGGSYSYNSVGDLTSFYEDGVQTTIGYDPIGRPTSSTAGDGGVTTYVYDASGRVTSVVLPKPTATSPLNFAWTITYDNYDAATGLVFTNVTDPNGRVTKTGSDALGHVIQTIDAAGNVTTFTYQYGLLKRITDANGNATTYTYNGNRELSATTFPEGATETYNISNGLLLSMTDRKGQTISSTYDGVGRVTRITYVGVLDPYGSSVGQEFSYAGQNLAFIVDHTPAAATTYQYTYDSSWRRTVETIFGGEKTTYTYVSSPWPSRQVQSFKIEPSTGTPWNPQTVTYGYDGGDRVNSISWNWIPSGSFSFIYTPTGEYSRITFPNGQTRNYSYDNQGRLTNVTNNDPGGGILASFTYGYDFDWGTNANTMLGQRTSVFVSAAAGTNLELGTTKYRYDSLYELTRVDHPSGQFETWTYDAIGNRTSANGIAYEYYKNGQNPLNGNRLRTDRPGWPDMLYDASGNLKGPSNLPNTYGWDYAGRLTSSSGATYAYDFLGRRRSATSGSSTTKYLVFGAHTVAERNTTTGVATDYLFGPGIDEPLAKIVASGTISYYGVDGLGSIVLVTNASGAVTDSTVYGAWGGNGSEPFGFTGREGSFFRARYYSSGWGRFMSEDPLYFAGDGMSRYAYAANDPVNQTDPTGMFTSRNSVLQRVIRRISQAPLTAPLALDKMKKNYDDMIRANTKRSDKYFHCMANCEAAHLGPVGGVVAGIVSDTREAVDQHVKGDPPYECEMDQYVNRYGRYSDRQTPCKEVCKPFRPNGLPPQY